jgi:hypothetical protein
MNKLLTAAALAAAYVVAFASPTTAEIVGVFAAGPGGIVSPLEIETTVNTNDTVIYGSNYTSAAPIYITLTLSAGDSNTQFFVAQVPNFLANNSGVVFRNFYVDLVSAPRGTTFNEAGSASNAFGTPIFDPT